ncbi:MAG: bifunctional diaminohydroxyphosphoribosylaminopyrimidine deaminase/5-amino-6-(5-phosphoribosylamino)uracil reductase RibD [Alphaproteobacteria bacterium]
MNDLHYMRYALSLSKRGIGQVAPNPSVGCVFVKDGRVLSVGWTGQGGRPHAEAAAIALAKKRNEDLKGATAYVTLEPCSHHGKTPPCAEALIQAGITRAVIATMDPDPRVSGKGIALLEAAGITVETGLLEDEAQKINVGFFSRILHKRPFITLKIATSLDGKIALGNGESKWITSPLSRRRAQLLRHQHDAIMVGKNTVIQDDPRLTSRLQNTISPLRVVLDTQGQLSHDYKIFDTVAETLHLTKKEIKTTENGLLDLTDVMQYLATKGITRLLAEGGAALATHLLKENLVDQLIWFRAPKIIGNDGLAGLGTLNLSALSAAGDFEKIRSLNLGNDLMEIYEKPLT